MADVASLPSPGTARGEVFLDTRGSGRALRVSWHREVGVVVLSLWRGHGCAGTFRLAQQEVPAFVEALVEGLDDAYPAVGQAAGAS
ncbi:MAG: hypothetical protein ACRDO1_14000 [Nocardioidaceae bacterium]